MLLTSTGTAEISPLIKSLFYLDLWLHGFGTVQTHNMGFGLAWIHIATIRVYGVLFLYFIHTKLKYHIYFY